MKIAVGSDHVGFPLKEAVAEYLREKQHEVVDCGAFATDPPYDYPRAARSVGEMVSRGTCERGVVVCGTGVGISIAVNRFPGVRAVLCNNLYLARQSRIHNDANLLALGGLVTTPEMAREILDVWLATPFEGGRHIPRLAMLDLPAQESGDDAGKLASLDRSGFQMGVSLSPEASVFGPLMFAGNLKDGIDHAARLGFDGVELSLRDPETLDGRAIQKMVRDAGLTTAAIATGQSCLRDGLCLLSADAEKRKMALGRLQMHLQLAETLGARLIVGGVRGRTSGSPQQQAQQKGFMKDAVASLVSRGRILGVTVVIEPINRYETNYINSINEGLSFLDEVGDPSLKLVPDTFHMNIEERDMVASLVRAGDRIGYMHFADSNRRPAGQGHTNFVQVLAALVTAGYHGMITSEVLPLPDDDTAMAQAAGFMRALLGR